MNKWVIRKKSGNLKLLCETMGVSSITGQVLINRGLLSEDIIETFLNTSLNKLNDFTVAKDVLKAVELLDEEIKKGSKIVIYGDYDVDGVTSTTILYKSIKFLTDNVFYFLPNREHDGYGLNIKRIDELIEQGIDVIITCDNGIASIVENDYIQKKGIKHIVIDHHEEPINVSDKYLKPNAIIDPKQSDCPYPFKEMCAGGLSYRFVNVLFEKCGKKPNFLDELLVFAMIATICDIVPLVNDNRIIVKEGLAIFNKNKEINYGLNSILYKKSILDKEIDTYTIGFVIGPTINVAGRLSEAMTAVNLFTSDDHNEIYEIATNLHELNSKRQELTKNGAVELIEKIEKEKLYDNQIIVVYSENVDEAVAGIVCGRIKEKYNRPSIVVTDSGDILKGSCRSTSFYDMHKELDKVSNYFLKFGGHKMAAGFSMEKKNFFKFKENLLANANLTDDDFIKVLAVDDILKLENISYKEAKNLDILKPFGQDNKEPLFASLNCKVTKVRLIEEKNTLILSFTDESEKMEINAITFSLVDEFISLVNDNFDSYIANKILNGVLRDIDLILDIVYYININEYNGRQSVQLKIEDFRLSKQ